MSSVPVLAGLSSAFVAKREFAAAYPITVTKMIAVNAAIHLEPSMAEAPLKSW
jgi:hypothetical protein